MADINTFCLSSYLAFRYVAKKNSEWMPGIGPVLPPHSTTDLIPVGSPHEILMNLRMIIQGIQDLSHTGILLSGGIDSAILAALIPQGSYAYTINFIAKSGANEAERASKYAEFCKLKHKVIDVEWKDYSQYESLLMTCKKAPLHPVEVALYKTAMIAKKDGVKRVILGNGADSTFGGLDKLLSKDWHFDEFIKRYVFVDPTAVLKDPADINNVFCPYKRGDHIDFLNFLKEVHGIGVIQAFNNSIKAAGIKIEEPFERLKLKGNLDLNRIRSGEPKYLLIEVFKELYPDFHPPFKVPFARPMDEWLSDYPGPKSKLFKSNIDICSFSGDQKYLIRCLDKFIHLIEAAGL